MKYKNMPKNQAQLMVSLIQEYDPGLENFLNAVACLMEQTSGDKDKQLSPKQIAVNVARLPLIAMKSKIVFAHVSKWQEDSSSTIQFLDDANESLNTNGYDQENVEFLPDITEEEFLADNQAADTILSFVGIKPNEDDYPTQPEPEIVKLEFNDEGLTDSMVASREFHAERNSKPKKSLETWEVKAKVSDKPDILE